MVVPIRSAKKGLALPSFGTMTRADRRSVNGVAPSDFPSPRISSIGREYLRDKRSSKKIFFYKQAYICTFCLFVNCRRNLEDCNDAKIIYSGSVGDTYEARVIVELELSTP